MKRIFRVRDAGVPALLELKTSLQETQTALDHAYTAFDYTSDPELTEACIYEIRSLQARMNYLLRQIKELEMCTATTVSGPQNNHGRHWGKAPTAVPAVLRTARRV